MGVITSGYVQKRGKSWYVYYREDGIFRELWDMVQTCRAEGIMRLHETVMTAAENDPRLALEMLSRMQLEVYGKKTPFHDLERAAAEEIVNNGNDTKIH